MHAIFGLPLLLCSLITPASSKYTSLGSATSSTAGSATHSGGLPVVALPSGPPRGWPSRTAKASSTVLAPRVKFADKMTTGLLLLLLSLLLLMSSDRCALALLHKAAWEVLPSRGELSPEMFRSGPTLRFVHAELIPVLDAQALRCMSNWLPGKHTDSPEAAPARI